MVPSRLLWKLLQIFSWVCICIVQCLPTQKINVLLQRLLALFIALHIQKWHIHPYFVLIEPFIQILKNICCIISLSIEIIMVLSLTYEKNKIPNALQ